MVRLWNPRLIGRLRPGQGGVRQRVWSCKPNSTLAPRWSTPLAKNLAEAIQTTGPISLATYMRQCLTSVDGGYYTSEAARDPIGKKGDFVTSPEISQVFGELIGIWIIAEWMAQGKSSNGVDLIETFRSFKSFAASIRSVALVEASPSLRARQKALLCGENAWEDIHNGHRSYSKDANIPVTWYDDIRFVPHDVSHSPFIVAHEFFDALPIHAFQSVAPSSAEPAVIQGLNGPVQISHPPSSSQKPQWRELVVTPATAQPACEMSGQQKDQPEFQISLAKASTPSSLVLPETSPRYRALQARPDAVIEISPEAQSYAADFARRLGGAPSTPTDQVSAPTARSKLQPSGAALIIDYGPSDAIPTSTLRGIRSHALVSPLSSPGLVDLSADVDFLALAEAALDASPGVEVHGPVEQGSWLKSMGIGERVDQLCKRLGHDEEGKKRIHMAMNRLVERGGGGMGRLYKVMAIVPEGGGQRKPVGFGGEVTSED